MDEKSTFVIFKLEPLADLFCLSALHMRIISAYISWFIEEGGKNSVNLSLFVLLLIQRLWTNSFSTIFLNRIQQIIHRLFKFFYQITHLPPRRKVGQLSQRKWALVGLSIILVYGGRCGWTASGRTLRTTRPSATSSTIPPLPASQASTSPTSTRQEKKQCKDDICSSEIF